MTDIKLLTGACLLAVSVIFTSCVSKPVYFNKTVIDREKVSIAVLPFRDYNRREGNNSGDLVRNVFETKLINRGFRTVDVEKVSSQLEMSNFKETDISIQWIKDTGREVGADYMIFGSVHDYRVFEYSTTFIYIFEWLETTYSLGVTARMVSCKTGNVVWSGTYNSKSYTFNDAAEEVVTGLLRTMKYKSGRAAGK